ncbi:MAG: RidA family protein [Pseudomonadota bacterium]
MSEPQHPSLRQPFGRYRHVVAIEKAQKLVFLSGQVAIRADDAVPEGVEAQTRLIFENIELLLQDQGLNRRHLLRLTTFLLDPGDRDGYMRVRDAWVMDPAPASTLIYVAGLADPAFRVEIEATAAA